MPKRARGRGIRVTPRRVVPRYADMGELDGSTRVRVDVNTRRFDVRDVLQLALITERAVKTACSVLGDDFGVPAGSSERLRWAGGDTKSNARGHGRLVADAGACVTMIRAMVERSQRKALRTATEIALWFERRDVLQDAVPVHPTNVG